MEVILGHMILLNISSLLLEFLVDRLILNDYLVVVIRVYFLLLKYLGLLDYHLRFYFNFFRKVFVFVADLVFVILDLVQSQHVLLYIVLGLSQLFTRL